VGEWPAPLAQAPQDGGGLSAQRQPAAAVQ
jgi:hypothetical protein